MTDQVNLITYPELLNELKSTPDIEKHLLLGNGFNSGLGVDTSYESIFSKMKEERSDYDKVDDYMKNVNYDVEQLIADSRDKAPSEFLKNIIEDKIKIDFMKAAYSITKKDIKNIYQERNKGIHMLFKNFTNYFTLNYDPLLYLLLMKFKKDGSNVNTMAFPLSRLFQSEELDETQNNIYTIIKEARVNGNIKINFHDNPIDEDLDNPIDNDLENLIDKDLKSCSKAQFVSIVKDYSKKKNKNWTSKDINNVCNLIWKEEKGMHVLPHIDDGFWKSGNSVVYNPRDSQNIYFLHGSFHIYKDKEIIKKITQTQNEALYERLENIINSEGKNLMYVLRGTSAGKMEDIKNNRYLKNSHDKLATLQGHLVILGSSLDSNDMHIFNAINKSQISDIYISSKKEMKDDDYKKAKQIFPEKKIWLFNYRNISYNSD